MKLENVASGASSGVYQPTLSVELDCSSVRTASTYTSALPSSYYY